MDNKKEVSKNIKSESQTQLAASKQSDNKSKKSASTTTTKKYFTAGAQGDDKHSYRILDILIDLFEQAIRKAFPEDQTLPVLVMPGQQSDYQCNSAMPIAQVSENVN